MLTRLSLRAVVCPMRSVNLLDLHNNTHEDAIFVSFAFARQPKNFLQRKHPLRLRIWANSKVFLEKVSAERLGPLQFCHAMPCHAMCSSEAGGTVLQ